MSPTVAKVHKTLSGMNRPRTVSGVLCVAGVPGLWYGLSDIYSSLAVGQKSKDMLIVAGGESDVGFGVRISR